MSEMTTRQVSPAILEQRILDLNEQVKSLEINLENERINHEKTRFERDCYKTRIEGFERMSHQLAIHVDKICREFDQVTGGAFAVSGK